MAARLIAFLNSSLGMLLMGSVIGAVGLFTWQRQDWLFKEKYLRTQVMVDRRLNLIEQINREGGRFVSAADDVIAAYSKGVSNKQKNEAVNAYNKEQAQWSGNYGSQQAMLRFYFSDKEIDGKFLEIVTSSKELDARLDSVWAGSDPAQAAEISQRIRGELEMMNQLALQRLLSAEAK
jgi:hypothetical protein